MKSLVSYAPAKLQTKDSGDLSEGYSYFDNGNIKRKTDVSAQDYQYHLTKPHALVGVNDVINPVASLQEQSISYNSAQDPISISENGYTLNFEYGPHNNRVRSVLSHDEQVQQNKTYLSNMEILEVGDATTHIHYIAGGDGLAAFYVEKNGEGNYYFAFKDYLGSILTLADKNGNIVQEQSFDAWGRYRNTEDWSYDNLNPPTLADGDFTWLRGYTGHEYLPQFSLIHMNGRLYDPYLGRMLSPDNFVHTDFGTQGYNRYSYANNNPLKYTDPSGEILWLPFAIGAAVGMYIGGTIANDGELNPIEWDYQSSDTWKGMAIGFVLGAIAGESLGALGTGELAFGHFAVEGSIVLFGAPVVTATSYGQGTSFSWTPTEIGGDINIKTDSPIAEDDFSHALLNRYFNSTFGPHEIGEVEVVGNMLNADQNETEKNSYFENALQYENVKYKWGGMSKDGMDCSGLVCLATKSDYRWTTSSGNPPGNWYEVFASQVSRTIFLSESKKGDLYLWSDRHVAFYAGDKKLFHARGTNASGKVEYTNVDWWILNRGFPNVFRQFYKQK